MSESKSTPDQPDTQGTECQVEYRDIPGFIGYRVGSDGTVWTRCKTGGNENRFGQLGSTWRPRRVRVGTNGYPCVVLRQNGRRVERMIHHLVMEAFVGPRPEGMEIRHFPDPTKTNVALANLCYGTSSENKRDKYPGRAEATHKVCSGCNVNKPIHEFIARTSSIDGRGSWCRDCHRKYARQRRRARTEKRRAAASGLLFAPLP